MRGPGLWTRRQFSQAVGVGAASSLLGWSARAEEPRGPQGFAYVGSSADGGAIHCFRVSGSRWQPVQAVAAPAPMHLEPHPTLPVLYAVHAVGLWENLPRGAVSAYRIDTSTGRLALCSTQPLSLAATYPRHAAVSPDGSSLLVAAEYGGIYNLLPLAEDGGLQPPTAICKEVGGASPRHVLFHPDGVSVLTADAGQKSIGVFTCERDALTVQHRMASHAGGNPLRIAYSPWSGCVYALHAGDGSLAAHRFDGVRLHAPSQLHWASQPGLAAMALHPAGRFLVTSNPTALTALAIDERTGHLAACDSIPQDEAIRALSFTPAGTHLCGVGVATRTILQIDFDPLRGILGRPQPVAAVASASSLLFRPA